MDKTTILRLVADSVRPQDSYNTAEVKVRIALRAAVTKGLIASFDMKSDPSSCEHSIYWLTSGKRLEKLRLDIKRIDRDLLTIMEVLES